MRTIEQINTDIAEDVPVFTTRKELEGLGFVCVHSVWTLPEEVWSFDRTYSYVWNRESGSLMFQGVYAAARA